MTDTQAKQLEDKVGMLTSRMTLYAPFISAVFTRLEREFITEDENMTACVNGRTVKFGVQWCSQWDDEKLLFLCLHEALHVVFMHMWRRNGRNPALFNIATDALINRMLINMGFASVQLVNEMEGVLIDWVGEEMDVETIYARLRREQGSQSGDGDGQVTNTSVDAGEGGFGGTGDLEDAPGDAAATDMEATIVAAAKMAKACGDGSAVVKRVLGGALKPTIPWADVTRHILRSASRDDYSYRRFNRTLYRHTRLVAPTLYSDAMGPLAIAFDLSGSVSQTEANQIAGEVTAIAEDLNPERVDVIYFAGEVTHTESFERGEPVQLHPKGCGGTRFQPVFEHIREKGLSPEAVIFFSDMCGNLAECEDPGCPVIWGSTDGRAPANPPFGTVVEVDV